MNRPIILAACLLAASAARAGVRYTATTEFPGQDRTESSQMLVDSERLRIDTSEGGEVTILFHGGREEMTLVDHTEKSYMVLDKATVDGMAAMVSEAMQQMEQALQSMPQAQREQMEKMMKQRMDQTADATPMAEAEITDLGDAGSVGDLQCSWKAVHRNGSLERKICVADWGDIRGGDEMMAVQEKMVEFSQRMRDAFSQGGANPMAQSFERHAMKEMTLGGGFPLITERYDGDTLLERSTFAAADDAAATDADFAPPPGYMRQEMGDMGPRRPRRN